MSTLPRTTIEQWAVLRTVVDEGGFAAAAAALHRSQSSISYAISRLQEAMGLELLETRGRRAVLTEAGAVLLADVRPLIEDLIHIEQRGGGIATGNAIHIQVLVDSLFPRPRLLAAFERIAREYPHAEIHLVEAVRQTTDAMLLENYDIAILATTTEAPDAHQITSIPLVAVARAEHPLVISGETPTRAALARHACVEVRGVSGAQPPPYGRRGRAWRVNTIEAGIDAVRYGLCYGWLPEYLIEADLAQGTLVRLPLHTGRTRHVPLSLHVRETGAPLDAATAELARLLRTSD